MRTPGIIGLSGKCPEKSCRLWLHCWLQRLKLQDCIRSLYQLKEMETYTKKKSYEHKPNSIAYNWTSVTVVTNRELQNQFEISQNQEVKVKSCKPQHRLWYSPVRQNSTNLVYVHNWGKCLISYKYTQNKSIKEYRSATNTKP